MYSWKLHSLPEFRGCVGTKYRVSTKTHYQNLVRTVILDNDVHLKSLVRRFFHKRAAFLSASVGASGRLFHDGSFRPHGRAVGVMRHMSMAFETPSWRENTLRCRCGRWEPHACAYATTSLRRSSAVRHNFDDSWTDVCLPYARAIKPGLDICKDSAIQTLIVG